MTPNMIQVGHRGISYINVSQTNTNKLTYYMSQHFVFMSLCMSHTNHTVCSSVGGEIKNMEHVFLSCVGGGGGGGGHGQRRNDTICLLLLLVQHPRLCTASFFCSFQVALEKNINSEELTLAGTIDMTIKSYTHPFSEHTPIVSP